MREYYNHDQFDSPVRLRPVTDDDRRTSFIEEALEGRIDFTQRLVRDNQGREVASSGTIIVEYRPDAGDRFRIDGVEYAVAGIEDLADFSRRYWKVHLA